MKPPLSSEERADGIVGCFFLAFFGLVVIFALTIIGGYTVLNHWIK